MDKLIKWVINVEDEARKFYEKASSKFTDDPSLERLLAMLAEDERRHHALALRAYNLAKNDKKRPLELSAIDGATMNRVGDELKACIEMLDNGELCLADILEAIVTLEHSEVNDIFLYVAKAFKVYPDEFLTIVADIQSHQARIERFVESRPGLERVLDKIRNIPSISGEKILVVDDEEGLLDTFRILLAQLGEVDVATNGAEALALLEKGTYTAIISDINMPIMDGMVFYRKASERWPNLAGRFLFITSSVDETCEIFFKENMLRHLLKPAPILDIKRALVEIINTTRSSNDAAF